LLVKKHAYCNQTFIHLTKWANGAAQVIPTFLGPYERKGGIRRGNFQGGMNNYKKGRDRYLKEEQGLGGRKKIEID